MRKKHNVKNRVEALRESLWPARRFRRVQTLLDPSRKGSETLRLETGLRQRVVGQEEAIQRIANTCQVHATGLAAPGRPIGNFLFLGPTGSGKTRIVEATADVLLNNPKAFTQIHCGEFSHNHEIAKLVGSPPGYMGHHQTLGRLSQEWLGQYYTSTLSVGIVLFDEIEKGSSALWNLLLGILDKATLTLGDNRKSDFSKTLIFMTSNLGSAEVGELLTPHYGLTPEVANRGLRRKIKKVSTRAARRNFTPEFFNRLDWVVTFDTLGSEELAQVLEMELETVQQQIFRNTTVFQLELSDEAKAVLLREGTSHQYGARHLKRALQRLVREPISNLLASGQIQGGDLVRVYPGDTYQGLAFVKEAIGVPGFSIGRTGPEVFHPDPIPPPPRGIPEESQMRNGKAKEASAAAEE